MEKSDADFEQMKAEVDAELEAVLEAKEAAKSASDVERLTHRPKHMPCTIDETGTDGAFTQVWFHAYDEQGRLVRAHRKLVGQGLEREPPDNLEEWRSRYEYDDQGRLIRYVEMNDDLTEAATDNKLNYEDKRVTIQGTGGESHNLGVGEDGQYNGDVFAVFGQVGMSSHGFGLENPFQRKITYLAGELIVGQVLSTISFGGGPEKPLSTVSYDGPGGGISEITSQYSGWKFGYCE